MVTGAYPNGAGHWAIIDERRFEEDHRMSKWKHYDYQNGVSARYAYRTDRNEALDLLEAVPSFAFCDSAWTQRCALLDRLREPEKQQESMTLENGDVVVPGFIDGAVVVQSKDNRRLGIRLEPQHAPPAEKTVRERVDEATTDDKCGCHGSVKVLFDSVRILADAIDELKK